MTQGKLKSSEGSLICYWKDTENHDSQLECKSQMLLGTKGEHLFLILYT